MTVKELHDILDQVDYIRFFDPTGKFELGVISPLFKWEELHPAIKDMEVISIDKNWKVRVKVKIEESVVNLHIREAGEVFFEMGYLPMHPTYVGQTSMVFRNEETGKYLAARMFP